MATTRRLSIVPVMIVLAIVAGIALTAHALAVRPETGQSRADMWGRIETAVNGGPSDQCRQLIVASCPNATVHDRMSASFGQPSPQIRAACCDGTNCTMAVIGMREPTAPVLVSVMPMARARFEKVLARDNCTASDWTLIKDTINLVH